MSDIHTAVQRHRNMAAIRSANTMPEQKLRKELWRRGFRFRINDKRFPGKPDIVFPKYHTVLFVHGCFWHGHKVCGRFKIPKTNTDFWMRKIARNQERDQEVWRQLEAKGWAVIIVWECQITKAELEKTIIRVEEELRRNRKNYCQELDERRNARMAYREERRQLHEREMALKSELNLSLLKKTVLPF